MTGGWSRLSLRARLVVTVLVLLALALALTGLTVSALLRGYLAGRVDQEMVTAVERLRDSRAGRPFGGPRPAQELPSRYVVQVLDGDGVTRTELRPPVTAGTPPELTGVTGEVARQRAGTPYTVDAADGSSWRVLLTSLGDGRTLALATSLEDVEQTIARLRRVVLGVDLVVLAAGALVGLAAVRGSLRPLARIEETAAAIAAGDLSRRVPEEGAPNTEVGRLSRALNGMLAQIETAFAVRADSERRTRRFMADASHELRTPLTSVRGYAELYRQGAVRDPDELDRLMRRIEDEAARMGGLVEDLLLLARLDERRPLRRDPVDVVVLAADAVHDARASSADHHVRLETPADEGGVVVSGDEERLRQVLMNLVTNALRHTPAGTTVTVRADREGSSAVLEVADDGPGLPAGTEESVFEGFTRGDPSRGRDSGGTGLGLTIVAALVGHHGGRVDARTTPGGGATFRVRLPLADGSG